MITLTSKNQARSWTPVTDPKGRDLGRLAGGTDGGVGPRYNVCVSDVCAAADVLQHLNDLSAHELPH